MPTPFQSPTTRRLTARGKSFVHKIKGTFWVNGILFIGKKEERPKVHICQSYRHSSTCHSVENENNSPTSSLAESSLFTSSKSSTPSPTISSPAVLRHQTTAAESEVDNAIAESEIPVARNLRVDSLGIYVEIENTEHFFTWDQFEQFLLDERNTAHLPPDDVVRRTADILRENKKVQQ
ncbi:hypothetical protein BT69DRAFT_1288766 [Atractiella rhizophila]|nr:hypothetical protein BT69DRAFT_1288766 [Atractiella rhizophila]